MQSTGSGIVTEPLSTKIEGWKGKTLPLSYKQTVGVYEKARQIQNALNKEDGGAHFFDDHFENSQKYPFTHILFTFSGRFPGWPVERIGDDLAEIPRTYTKSCLNFIEDKLVEIPLTKKNFWFSIVRSTFGPQCKNPIKVRDGDIHLTMSSRGQNYDPTDVEEMKNGIFLIQENSMFEGLMEFSIMIDPQHFRTMDFST